MASPRGCPSAAPKSWSSRAEMICPSCAGEGYWWLSLPDGSRTRAPNSMSVSAAWEAARKQDPDAFLKYKKGGCSLCGTF